MSTGTQPIVDAKFTSKQKDFETPESTMCILLHAVATTFLQVCQHSTFLFLSYFTLLLLFLFVFHLPAVLILLCCCFTLLLVLFPLPTLPVPFPGFPFGLPLSQTIPGCHQGQQAANRVASCHENEGSLLSNLTPPASPAKPLPPELPPLRPKRQRDKGKGVFEG